MNQERTNTTSARADNSTDDKQDLHDSERDRESLKPENGSIDLPDVKDIPGQEFIHPMPLGELADTTLSSDDEEGVGILDDDPDTEPLMSDTSANVSKIEKKVLQQADEDMPGNDEDNLRKAEMDNVDEDGTPLNEKGFGEDVSGDDLDISGADNDDADEEIGEEDEENNEYSLGADKD